MLIRLNPRAFQYENHMKGALWTHVDALDINATARGKDRIPGSSSPSEMHERVSGESLDGTSNPVGTAICNLTPAP